MPDADDADESRVIKVRMTFREQDTIRLAAALRRQSLAEFVRSTTLAEAERLTKGINWPEAAPATPDGTRRSRRRRAGEND